MGFGTGSTTPYDAFVAKYGLTAGFGGLLDLKSVFGDLINETSFVRDRVSSTILTGSFITVIELCCVSVCSVLYDQR